jgi:hypothetical protein
MEMALELTTITCTEQIDIWLQFGVTSSGAHPLRSTCWLFLEIWSLIESKVEEVQFVEIF